MREIAGIQSIIEKIDNPNQGHRASGIKIHRHIPLASWHGHCMWIITILYPSYTIYEISSASWKKKKNVTRHAYSVAKPWKFVIESSDLGAAHPNGWGILLDCCRDPGQPRSAGGLNHEHCIYWRVMKNIQATNESNNQSMNHAINK